MSTTRFTIQINTPTPEGEVEARPLTIQVNPPKIDRSWGRWRSTFSIKIPEYIWNTLAGRELPSRDGYRGRAKDVQTYGSTTRTFPKTITKETIRDITEEWDRLTSNYLFALELDNALYEKVIFYELGSKATPFTAAWQKDAQLGITSQASFSYAVGYLLELSAKIDSWGERHQSTYRYDTEKKIVPHYQNEKFYQLKWVRWTESRQLFFDALQVSFDQLRDKIDSFEKQISEKKIDELVASSVRLLEG